MSYAVRFAMFWYDFLIGGKAELFVGPIVAMIIVGIGLKVGLDATLAGLLFFALIVLVAAFSLTRSLRSAARR